ncbi:MAG: (2Fe-2S)-binding protein [Sedimentisphaerales bacterium]|nr:(2Fe-2S)-binding protein [Sedimentisphaerales bacterium]
MPKLTIDNHQVEVPDGATILDAAGKVGIEIPTLCYADGCEPTTSCMLCVVEVAGHNRLLPACATKAAEGMVVLTKTNEIIQTRKGSLELLLSDHVGDCMGPCQTICPAQMNIPLMIRQIAADELREAIITVKRDIALPAVLGRICPAPCEKGCRRGEKDSPVAICVLKRFVADTDLVSDAPYLPPCRDDKGKQVAIVGAGPAGLAGAYYLRQYGYRCTVFDNHEKAGGNLQYAVSEDLLPRQVLDKEIDAIEKTGIDFKLSTRIGTDISMQELLDEYDAILIAAGLMTPDNRIQFGLETTDQGIVINRQTYCTSLPKVFAAGGAVRLTKMAVRAVAQGKDAAFAIDQYLTDQTITGPEKLFNSRIGSLINNEIETFMALAEPNKRTDITPTSPQGLTPEQARAEAFRCLHCDCRKPDDCKLRLYAQQYDAKISRYKAQRRQFEQNLDHPDIIYEPGKCIGCGLCIQIAAQYQEELGLSFINRGFNVRVAVPFNEKLSAGLKKAASQCVNTCPTGALAFK